MNLNKAIIIGNVVRDPEVRQIPSGQSVASFSIATNRMWTDKTGQKQQKAEFHNIVAWGKLAEICQKYLNKGKLVMVEGRIETRSWEGQDGVKKYKTEIIAENVQLGPKTSSSLSLDKENEQPIQSGEEEIEIKDIPF